MSFALIRNTLMACVAHVLIVLLSLVHEITLGPAVHRLSAFLAPVPLPPTNHCFLASETAILRRELWIII